MLFQGGGGGGLGARHLGTRRQVNPTSGGNQRKLPSPVLTFCLDLKSYKNNMHASSNFDLQCRP